jgi:hypothetical protein
LDGVPVSNTFGIAQKKRSKSGWRETIMLSLLSDDVLCYLADEEQ